MPTAAARSATHSRFPRQSRIRWTASVTRRSRLLLEGRRLPARPGEFPRREPRSRRVEEMMTVVTDGGRRPSSSASRRSRSACFATTSPDPFRRGPPAENAPGCIVDGDGHEEDKPRPSRQREARRLDGEPTHLRVVENHEEVARSRRRVSSVPKPPELGAALLKIAEESDSRAALLLLAEILRTPGLAERLSEVLRPGTFQDFAARYFRIASASSVLKPT